MKFTCTVTIFKPKAIVAELFANPEFLGEYQEGFLRKDHISGDVGQDRAVAKLYYTMGKGQMELTETILQNELPNRFLAQYHHKFTDNTMCSVFTAINEHTTRYDAEIHYTAIRGLMPKFMKTIAPSFFKKQVQKWLNNFKNFVEKQP